MICLEIFLLVELFSLGVISSITDIKKGLIYNRILLFFLVVGVITATCYYVFFVTDLLSAYLVNISIVGLLSLILFFTHSFAGGDTKLLLVLSVLFPARYYISYNGSNYTLLFALCLALLFGFGYLFISSLRNLILKKTSLSFSYIKAYIWTFWKTYFLVLPYIILVNLLFQLISRYTSSVNSYLVAAVCFVIAWTIHRVSVFKKWYTISTVITMDIALSVVLKTIPFSVQPSNYIFTFIVILLQLSIKSNLYEPVPTSEVKAGMILSMASSVLMQSSRISGIPGISHEDLRDRLTEEQAEAVRKWGLSSKGSQQVSIMKKIPFAVFLTLGFLSYLVLWRVLL